MTDTEPTERERELMQQQLNYLTSPSIEAMQKALIKRELLNEAARMSSGDKDMDLQFATERIQRLKDEYQQLWEMLSEDERRGLFVEAMSLNILAAVRRKMDQAMAATEKMFNELKGTSDE